MNTETLVFRREGFIGKREWRQYLVIQDGRVTVIDMTPALFGWNFGRVTIQTGDDWAGMDARTIVAWKDRAYPGDLIVPDQATIDLVLAKLPELLAAK